MNKKNSKFLLDKIGMCTSAVCLIHCLSIPLFILFGFDTVLKLVDQEWIELAIIAFGLFVGLVSFIKGFLSHRQHFIPILFVAGFLLLINGESVANSWVSAGLSVGGALIIIYAHVQNLKLRSYVFAN